MVGCFTGDALSAGSQGGMFWSGFIPMFFVLGTIILVGIFAIMLYKVSQKKEVKKEKKPFRHRRKEE